MSKGKVAVGSDHAGYEYKEKLKDVLTELGYACEDFGAASTASVDYPSVGRAVAEAVASGQCQWGLLICGTGIGMAMIANRVKGVRAALCYNEEVARLTREHNDANVIVLGQRTMGLQEVEKTLRSFFATEFSGDERHIRRIAAIDE